MAAVSIGECNISWGASHYVGERFSFFRPNTAIVHSSNAGSHFRANHVKALPSKFFDSVAYVFKPETKFIDAQAAKVRDVLIPIRQPTFLLMISLSESTRRLRQVFGDARARS